MAVHTHITPTPVGHSLLSTTAILPAEDAFTDLTDTVERAIELEAMLDHRLFGNPAHGITFAFADAAWRRALGLAELTVRVEAFTPQCMHLQWVAGCILALLEGRDVDTLQAAIDGMLLRERIFPLDGADARTRRTRALIGFALRIVTSLSPGVGRMRVTPRSTVSAPTLVPSAA